MLVTSVLFGIVGRRCILSSISLAVAGSAINEHRYLWVVECCFSVAYVEIVAVFQSWLLLAHHWQSVLPHRLQALLSNSRQGKVPLFSFWYISDICILGLWDISVSSDSQCYCMCCRCTFMLGIISAFDLTDSGSALLCLRLFHG